MKAKNIRISGGKEIVVPSIISSTPSEESVIVSVNTSTYSGKGTISSYRITTNPSNIIVDSGSPNVTVTGLVPGTSYTFSVRVTNSTGVTSQTSTFGSSSTPFRFKAGYNLGGYQSVSPATNVAVIRKITELDIISTLSAALPATLRAMASFSNSPSAGYIAGGETPAVNTYQKIDINSETRSTLTATMPAATFAFTGSSNNNTAGYNFGGYTTAVVNRIDKLLFSNETRSTLSSTLSQTLTSASAFSKNADACYIAGGQVFPANPLNICHKLTYSNDTVSNLGAILRTTLCRISSMENGSSTAYMYGGSTANNLVGSTVNYIDKFNFSTQTRSAVTATMTTTRCWPSIFSFQGSHAFIAGGGNTTLNVINSSKDKFTYSNETISTSTALPNPNQQAGFVTNTGIL